MQYFLMFPGDKEEDALNEANLVGESSFGKFWAGQGLKTVMKIVNGDVDYLDVMTIISDDRRYLSIGDFFEEIRNLKVYYNEN